jgi:DNA-binding beta-propeller fold protein YncE
MESIVFWLPVLFLSFLSQAQAPRRAHAPSAGALCVPSSPLAPVYSDAVDLSSHVACNATTSAGPWSARLSPDGQSLLVTLAGPVGSFGQENCLVARVDAATGAVSGATSVGLFPEEIAWTTVGTLSTGYVTNSTSGTVTVVDAQGQPQGTIALPDPLGFGSCFPFGIVAAPDQQSLYVGTLDGSGEIYVLDRASATVVDAVPVPGGHGRLGTFGRTLIVPATEYDPSFTSSVASVVFVDPSDPGAVGAVGRWGDAGVDGVIGEEGTRGAEYEREPRLPLDPPPPTRASARGASAIVPARSPIRPAVTIDRRIASSRRRPGRLLI